MRLHPTRATFHVALAGAAMVMIGVAAHLGPVVAFGGAMILAVAIGRAVALVSVTRLRVAGFEMVWTAPRRVVRLGRGDEVVLEAELRNRGHDEMRAVGIRAVASSMLETSVEPASIDLPAGSRVYVNVRIRAKRIGRWGIHGMALEVRGTPAGGEALYEVPLMFANPFGVEVLPQALHAAATSPRGGRSRRGADIGRPAQLAGNGDELRELRDHVAGDAFKRIAWKASAKRGRLIVREMEREERDVVWLVLDASAELWAGPEGKAPLDDGVDEFAALAARHLARGDQVGLVVFASRPRTWLPPAGGRGHGAKIAAALTSAASMIDSDRSELDEYEIAQRVVEHARPLDPRGLGDIPKSNLDMLAARAESLRARAPFAPRVPYARTTREQTLRHYVAAFGIEVTPRSDGEHDKAHTTLALALEKISKEKLRPSIVHIFSAPPVADGAVMRSVRRLRTRRVSVEWSVPAFERALGEPVAPSDASTVADVVNEAVRIRAEASRAKGDRVLRRLGVRPHVFQRQARG